MTGYYSMNAFDILFWTLAATLLAALLERDVDGLSARGAGRAVARSSAPSSALGLLNKISVLWLGCGDLRSGSS